MKLLVSALTRFICLFTICYFTSLDAGLSAQDYLYILNRGGSNLLSIPLDATNAPLTVVSEQGLINTYDMALDGSNNRLYWCNGLSHQITQTSAAVVNPQGTAIENISIPVDIDIDPIHQKIWWVDNQLKAVFRANLDGSEQEPFPTPQRSNPSSLAVYASHDLLFYADLDSNRIWSSTISVPKSTPIVTTDLEGPVRLLVDTIQGKLYWADDLQNRIERSNLDGTNREVFYKGLEGEFPYGLFLNQQQGKLYWTDYGKEKLMRANLDGTEVIEVVSSGLSDPVAVTMVTKFEKPGETTQRSDKDLLSAQQEPKVVAYPNPAKDILTIASIKPNQPIEWLRIYDKAGKQLLENNVGIGITTVDIHAFNEGFYNYTVSVSGQLCSGHFSIIR